MEKNKTCFPDEICGVKFNHFCKIIEDIQRYDEFTDELDELTNEGVSLYNMDKITNILCDLRALLGHLLGEYFGSYNTIDYFIYELDYGERYSKDDCTMDYQNSGDIVETPLRDVKELWLYYALDNNVINKEEYFDLLDRLEKDRANPQMNDGQS